MWRASAAEDGTESRDAGRFDFRYIIVVITLMIGLPMLYVLSLGPLVWMIEQGHLQTDQGFGRVVEICYEPLQWLYDRSPYSRRFLDWYVSFWI